MCRRVTRFAATLVWGPGAGVEAAGGLCLSRNETGVACRPEHVVLLQGRELRSERCSEADSRELGYPRGRIGRGRNQRELRKVALQPRTRKRTAHEAARDERAAPETLTDSQGALVGPNLPGVECIPSIPLSCNGVKYCGEALTMSRGCEA